MPQASVTRTTSASSRSAFFTASTVTLGRSTDTTDALDGPRLGAVAAAGRATGDLTTSGRLNASASATTPASRRSPACGNRRVREPMRALIALRIGPARPPQQRQPHDVAVDVVAVLAVVEQRDAVAGLARDRPTGARTPRSGRRPTTCSRASAARGARTGSRRSRAARVHVHRERDLQELVVLVPVDLGLEVEPPRTAHEPHRLRDRRRSPKSRTKRTAARSGSRSTTAIDVTSVRSTR